MSLSPYLKYGLICMVLITIHIVVLIVILDYRVFTESKFRNEDHIFKRSSEVYKSYKPSITFINADKHGFKAEWTQVILKDEPQIEGYKVILWELQNVTRYVQVKNPVTKKMELLKETIFPETVTEWSEAHLVDRSIAWVIEGKDNTSFRMKHTLKPYTWYDLEIVILIKGGEGPSERNNRFQVSN